MAYPVTPIKKSFQYGDQTVTLETSHMARQADGAVTVTCNDTVVLVTVCARKEAKAALKVLNGKVTGAAEKAKAPAKKVKAQAASPAAVRATCDSAQSQALRCRAGPRERTQGQGGGTCRVARASGRARGRCGA